VTDEGDCLWVLAGGGALYWTGQEFAAPPGPDLKDDIYLVKLLGGPDRGAYVTQPGHRGPWRQLFRLSDGQAVHVADFYQEHSGTAPCVYVSRSGRIYNWGARSLAVLGEGGWIREEARLDERNVSIIDMGERVGFYYGGRLYTIDPAGKVRELELPEPKSDSSYPLRAVAWGDHRLLRWRQGDEFLDAWDLGTLEPVSVQALRSAVAGGRVAHFRHRPGGRVLVPVRGGQGQGPTVYSLDPAGIVTEVPGLGDMVSEAWAPWAAVSVHLAGDGAVWSVLDGIGIARCEDGAAEIFDWRDGLPMSAGSRLTAGPRGSVITTCDEGVLIYGPSLPGSRAPRDYHRWEEFRIARGPATQDFEGNLWMIRADKLGHVSRWDGANWAHIPVPFDTTECWPAMTDDRGHLAVQVSGSQACYDIAEDGAERFEDLQELVVAAVRDGAQQFRGGRGFVGCLVQDGRRIWCSFGLYTLDYFDGERWTSFPTPERIEGIYESAEHGMLFQVHGHGFRTYENGLLAEVSTPEDADAKWLLGPQGMQPYEQQLLEKRPGAYLPVRGSRREGLRLPGWEEDAQGRPTDPEQQPRLSAYTARATPSLHGGFRAGGGRVIGGCMVYWPQSSALGPESPLGSNIRTVMEDRSHNLWFEVAHGRIFRMDLPDFRIDVQPIERPVRESLRIRATPTPEDIPADQLALFWRLDDGKWHGGETGGSTVVRFPRTGRYDIEIMGVYCAGGATALENEFVHVRATVEDQAD
jgi:hypothetical protein